jgi:hypothetical protein
MTVALLAEILSALGLGYTQVLAGVKAKNKPTPGTGHWNETGAVSVLTGKQKAEKRAASDNCSGKS